MDEQELDRRIRRMLEVAQTDAPAARRWHPPAPRRSRAAGILAAAAAVVVVGLMGFGLVSGLAGSSSDDASSSATTAGSGAETTIADTAATETTSSGATDSTAPVACTTDGPNTAGFGTMTPNTQYIDANANVEPRVSCPGRTVHYRLVLDNTKGTAPYFPESEVMMNGGGMERWTLGFLPQATVPAGESVVLEGDFVVPQVREGTYTVFVRNLPGSGATLEIRAQLP